MGKGRVNDPWLIICARVNDLGTELKNVVALVNASVWWDGGDGDDAVRLFRSEYLRAANHLISPHPHTDIQDRSNTINSSHLARSAARSTQHGSQNLLGKGSDYILIHLLFAPLTTSVSTLPSITKLTLHPLSLTLSSPGARLFLAVSA